MSNAKGIALLDVRLFVERERGNGAWEALKSSLDPADHAQLDSLVAVGWYDVQLYLRMMHALPGVLGRPAGDVVRDLGRFAAEHDLSVIHRIFLRLANPAYVLEKAGDYWGRFYETGTWNVVRESPTKARGELSGFDVADAVYCEFLTSYITRLFELVGARSVRVAHTKCRASGAPACVFAGEWR